MVTGEPQLLLEDCDTRLLIGDQARVVLDDLVPA